MISENIPTWTRHLPKDWHISRIKFCATKIGSGITPRGGSETYKTEGVALLRSQNVYDDGLRLEDVAYIDAATDEEMRRTRLKSDDVLLNITGASIGRTCIVPASVLPANVNQHVCIIRPALGMSPDFLSYVLKSRFIRDQILSGENGASREGLNYDQVGNLCLPKPSLSEQKKIAAFLDVETVKSDALKAKYTRLIELLGEKRLALISHVVTGRSLHDVPTRLSGIDWMGLIPAHWEVSQVRHLSTLITKGTTPTSLGKDFVVEGIRFIKVESISHSQTILHDKCAAIDEETDALLARSRVRANDLLVAIAGAIGRVAIALKEDVPANTNQAVAIVRPIVEKVKPDWLGYAFASSGSQRYLDDAAVQSAQANLSLQNLGRLPIAVPPLVEQERLLEALRRALAQLDEGKALLQKALALVMDRRIALITAAVTGQIDVETYNKKLGPAKVAV